MDVGMVPLLVVSFGTIFISTGRVNEVAAGCSNLEPPTLNSVFSPATPRDRVNWSATRAALLTSCSDPPVPYATPTRDHLARCQRDH